MTASIDVTQPARPGLGGPLAHDVHGDGPPLLLIHGLGGERGGWKPVLAPLARHARCWAIDLPGFGDSPPLPPGTAPGPRQLADAVERFVDEQRLPEPLAVVGHSLGGWIALELARRGLAHPVIALAPGGFWNEVERRYASVVLRTCARLARRLEPHAPALLRRRALRAALLAPMMARAAHMPPEDAIAAVRHFARAPGFDATLEAIDRPGSRLEAPETIASPVTLVWGRRDAILPPWQARRAASTLGCVRDTILVPGAGHALMWDAAEAVTRAVLDTLGATRCAPHT